jgi:hypothetical protein
MNVRPNIHELDRIRRDVGAQLRIEHEVTEPAPESLIALLRDLQSRILNAEREKVFAEVESRVEELLCAVGRKPRSRASR